METQHIWHRKQREKTVVHLSTTHRKWHSQGLVRLPEKRKGTKPGSGTLKEHPGLKQEVWQKECFAAQQASQNKSLKLNRCMGSPCLADTSSLRFIRRDLNNHSSLCTSWKKLDPYFRNSQVVWLPWHEASSYVICLILSSVRSWCQVRMLLLDPCGLVEIPCS